MARLGCPYIVNSKRLITVRRNDVRFKRLEELGVDLVERKDGIQIRLADFDLDIYWQEVLSTYTLEHERLCTEFAQDVLEYVQQGDLTTQAGPTQATFIEYLETGLVERNFRNLF